MPENRSSTSANPNPIGKFPNPKLIAAGAAIATARAPVKEF